MNIFVFCAPLVIGKGGMERTAVNVANYFSRQGVNVVVGFMADNNLTEPAYELDKKITKLPWIRSNANDFRSYRNLILNYNIDCAINFGASWQSMKIAAIFFGTGVPLINHEGSNPGRIISTNWAKPRKISIEKAQLERRILHAQSSGIRVTLPDYLNSVADDLRPRAFAFPNAFTSTCSVSTNVGKYSSKRIINIGGLKKHKNIAFLFEALALIKDRHSDWVLDIYSGLRHTEHVNEMKSLLHKLGLTNMVIFHGEVADVDKCYEAASIHVITSLEEGLSSSVAEAMVHGLPSIGINTCNGVRQLIKHGQNGFLVDPENPEVLAKYLDLLMSDGALRQKLGVSALDDSKIFEPDNVYKSWDNIVNSSVEFMTQQKKNVREVSGTSNYIYNDEALRLHKLLFGKAFVELLDRYYEIPGYGVFDRTRKQYLMVNKATNRKIVIFASGNLFNIGGLQRSYQFLVNHLINCGHSITLVGWEVEGGRHDNLAYPLNPRTRVKFVPHALNKTGFLGVSAILRDIKPNLAVIINSTQDSLMFAASCVENNVPYIQSIRGSYDYCLKYLWESKHIMSLVFMGALRSHVLMASYKQAFADSIKDKTAVIPSPIESATSFAHPGKPGPDGRFVILYSGRFSFEKRINILIDAFSAIKDKYPEWDLWLYGNGPLKDSLIDLVKSLDICNRVRFGVAENTDEMYKIYPAVHIKALPSEQEGCPMAMREAMAHGVPPIAFNSCSGANEIITHNYDGILVESESCASGDFAQGLETLIANPSFRYEMGRKAIITCQRFKPEVINHKWDLLVREAFEKDGEEYDGFVEARRAISKIAARGRYRKTYIFEQNEDLFSRYKIQYLTIYGARLFDVIYYLECYPDVKMAGSDPLLHYISQGWRFGYNPSKEFDTNLYVRKHMLNQGDMCPLFHFYTEGVFEGAWPIEVDDDYYIKRPGRKRSNEYSLENDRFFDVVVLDPSFKGANAQ